MVVEVESSLCLIKDHGRKAYGDVKLWFYALLTLAPEAFIPKWLPPPKERYLTIHWIGGVVSPKTGLNTLKRKNLLALPAFESWFLRPDQLPATTPTEQFWLLVTES